MGEAVSLLPPQVTRLARREREIATIIYTKGACTAKDIETLVFPPLSNAAIRSMLVRLVGKGILKREWGKRGRGQKFVYLPTITPAEVKRRALKQLSEEYFEGSLSIMLKEIAEALETTAELSSEEVQLAHD
jgi:predicted transcriptional regulator